MRKYWNYRPEQIQQRFDLPLNRQLPVPGIYHNGTWYNANPYGYQSVKNQDLQTVPQQQQQPVQTLAAYPTMQLETKHVNPATYTNFQPVQLIATSVVPQLQQQHHQHQQPQQQQQQQPQQQQQQQPQQQLQHQKQQRETPPAISTIYYYQPLNFVPVQLANPAPPQPTTVIPTQALQPQNVHFQPYQQPAYNYEQIVPRDKEKSVTHFKEQQPQPKNYQSRSQGSQQQNELDPNEPSTIQIDLSSAADVYITRTEVKLVISIYKQQGCGYGKTEISQSIHPNEKFFKESESSGNERWSNESASNGNEQMNNESAPNEHEEMSSESVSNEYEQKSDESASNEHEQMSNESASNEYEQVSDETASNEHEQMSDESAANEHEQNSIQSVPNEKIVFKSYKDNFKFQHGGIIQNSEKVYGQQSQEPSKLLALIRDAPREYAERLPEPSKLVALIRGGPRKYTQQVQDPVEYAQQVQEPRECAQRFQEPSKLVTLIRDAPRIYAQQVQDPVEYAQQVQEPRECAQRFQEPSKLVTLIRNAPRKYAQQVQEPRECAQRFQEPSKLVTLIRDAPRIYAQQVQDPVEYAQQVQEPRECAQRFQEPSKLVALIRNAPRKYAQQVQEPRECAQRFQAPRESAQQFQEPSELVTLIRDMNNATVSQITGIQALNIHDPSTPSLAAQSEVEQKSELSNGEKSMETCQQFRAPRRIIQSNLNSNPCGYQQKPKPMSELLKSEVSQQNCAESMGITFEVERSIIPKITTNKLLPQQKVENILQSPSKLLTQEKLENVSEIIAQPRVENIVTVATKSSFSESTKFVVQKTMSFQSTPKLIEKKKIYKRFEPEAALSPTKIEDVLPQVITPASAQDKISVQDKITDLTQPSQENHATSMIISEKKAENLVFKSTTDIPHLMTTDSEAKLTAKKTDDNVKSNSNQSIPKKPTDVVPQMLNLTTCKTKKFVVPEKSSSSSSLLTAKKVAPIPISKQNTTETKVKLEKKSSNFENSKKIPVPIHTSKQKIKETKVTLEKKSSNLKNSILKNSKKTPLPLPKLKTTNIDTLILNAVSDETVQPFGNKKSDQKIKKSSNKLSKLERKALRRETQKAQNQLVAAQKAAKNTDTKADQIEDNQNNNDNDKAKESEDKNQNLNPDLPSVAASISETECPQLKGVTDPQLRHGLMRIINKIVNL